MTPNGKVNRKALPVPDETDLNQDEPVASPATPSEEVMAGIIASLLEIELVKRDDNFFMLGGHSYKPPSIYPGKITLFWPREKLSHIRWWHDVSERTEVEAHIIPGNQVSWKTEHISALSDCLRKCLNSIQYFPVSFR